jgi:integration host factor subunit alpha
MTFTKVEITDNINRKTDFRKSDANQAVETILEIIKLALESGESVLITGFGKFCLKEKNERRGRNPVTGKDLTLGARRVVAFKCSSVLRNKINGESD